MIIATNRAWAGGTWYRIDCEKAGDSPGYRSLPIQQSKRRGRAGNGARPWENSVFSAVGRRHRPGHALADQPIRKGR